MASLSFTLRTATRDFEFFSDISAIRRTSISFASAQNNGESRFELIGSLFADGEGIEGLLAIGLVDDFQGNDGLSVRFFAGIPLTSTESIALVFVDFFITDSSVINDVKELPSLSLSDIGVSRLGMEDGHFATIGFAFNRAVDAEIIDFEIAPPPPPGTPTNGPDNLPGSDGADRIDALAGDDTVTGRGGDDTLLGQAGDDILRGGGGDDNLKGGGGADRMFGQGGADVLRGGGGNDIMKGGGAADRLIGGVGVDTLHGQKGDDTLKGGGGNDLFLFKPGDGDDVIQGFQQGRDIVEFQRGVSGFDALTIEQQGSDVLVSYNRGSILFINQNAGAFDADDFIF